MADKQFNHLEDKIVDGIKIANIYHHAEYYFRTSGYNHIFYFHCDLDDEDAVYNLCKKAFPEGKDHVKYDGSQAAYSVDHDLVKMIKIPFNEEEKTFLEKGCNWLYRVNEGNDD